MIPMDNVNEWILKIECEDDTDILSAQEKTLWDALSVEQKQLALKTMLENPVDSDSPVYHWYFRKKWGEALNAVCHNETIHLLEIGSGDTDMLPQILFKKYNHPDTAYTTMNANKKLTESFIRKTNGLPIQINVVEDIAQNMDVYFNTAMFDVIAFEHSFNDIIQAMLGERAGIDTIGADWFTVLPEMITVINREYLNDTLELNVKEEFLQLISKCCAVLKTGGFIIANHFQYQYDLDIGMNPCLWENFLALTRKWIVDAKFGEEVFFSGFDPQWWMFIKKS